MDTTRHIAEARDVDDTGAFGSSQDLWHKEVCQQEVPYVIGAKLNLEAIRRLFVILDGHECYMYQQTAALT